MLFRSRFCNVIEVLDAGDMYQKVEENFADKDIVIMAAAVSDYTPKSYSSDKIKKTEENPSIPLVRTKDILARIGAQKTKKQFVCGFSMETRDLIENSKAKLHRKNADLIVANNLKESGAGFGTDTNVVTLIDRDSIEKARLMSKSEVARLIVDKINVRFGS